MKIVNKGFIILPCDSPGDGALILTNDVDGPRDQATLYQWFGERNILLVSIPEGWDDVSRPVFASLEQFAEAVLDIKIVKD